MTTQDNMTFREFRPADAAAVHGLVLRTVEVSFAAVYAPSAIEHFRHHHEEQEILADAAGGCAVVVECGGRMVATGTLTGAGEIKRVYVHPDIQGRGLGRRIMAELERRGRQRGLARVFLHASLVARPFYEALGYRLLAAKTATMPDGAPLDYFEMDKPLADGAA